MSVQSELSDQMRSLLARLKRGDALPQEKLADATTTIECVLARFPDLLWEVVTDPRWALRSGGSRDAAHRRSGLSVRRANCPAGAVLPPRGSGASVGQR